MKLAWTSLAVLCTALVLLDASPASAQCVPTDPALEVCDGLDNDCNTKIDALDSANISGGLFLHDQPLCEMQSGVCAQSKKTVAFCKLGVWKVCNTSIYNYWSGYTYEAGAEILATHQCDGLDNDCDGLVDENYVPVATTCGVGACASPGMTTCTDGQVAPDANCTPGTPAADDASCNGIDDDCDGAIDDDYVATPTTCGIGACESTGAMACQGGQVSDTCVAGTAALEETCYNDVDDNCDGQVDEDCVPLCTPVAGNDETCDGVDDDCDDLIDEDYVGAPTSCGVGACVADGVFMCLDGFVVPDCTPGIPADFDLTCDGIDDDCNGAADDGYVAQGVSCGVGACLSEGQMVCVDGTESSTCTEGVGAVDDVTCDGIDDDCNGLADDGYLSLDTTCGVGACASSGATSCDVGQIVDSCVAGPAGSDDVTCDGIDDDCNGAADDGYVSLPTSCGEGGCANTGVTSCVEGGVLDSCVAGTALPDDLTCDGVDDDCNGVTDDGYVSIDTACGLGACASTGTTACSNGQVDDSCVPGQAAETDATCDGIDDDCNGAVDEEYAAIETACGVGACARSGITSCVEGTEQNSCVAGEAGTDDVTCDGIDDDCNGTDDDGYVSVETDCGVGACASTGATTCVDGMVDDSCVAGAAAADDVTCDGVDDDCNGAADDGYLAQDVTCGVGACMAAGQLVCLDGVETDTCTEGLAATDDVTCDGIDDDCNGLADDGYLSFDTTCGAGVCASTGATACDGGSVVDSCVAGEAAAADVTCDGLDENCDGTVDEGYVAVETSCGVGACASAGMSSCVEGQVEDSCVAGLAAPTDTTCNGIDDDCNGTDDDGFTGYATVCGVGVCASTGDATCVAGQIEDSCVVGEAAADDATCDGLDDDCDGSADEDYTVIATVCGVGACASTGSQACVEGAPVDSCVAGEPAADDTVCNGLDDDCDGEVDEDYQVTTTGATCGLGACRANEERRCEDGLETIVCVPGTPSPEMCDAIDNDCDGKTDSADGSDLLRNDVQYCENQIGSCAGAKKTLAFCKSGAWRPCNAAIYRYWNPTFAVAEGPACDGLDNDCDTATDEAYVAAPTSCGVTECSTTGELACVDGQVVDTCTPLEPAADDSVCNGLDDDCDGGVDEDFTPYTSQTTCGVGACTAYADATCEEGQLVLTCVAGEAAADDSTCNGLDDDCNGVIDDNGDLSCDDGDGCTVDACVEAQCTATIDEGASCDDLDPETIDDTCTMLGDCQGVPNGQLRYTDTQNPGAGTQPQECSVCGTDEYLLDTVHHVTIDDAGATPVNSVIKRVQVYLKASNVTTPGAIPWLAINGVYLAQAESVEGDLCDSCETYVFDSQLYWPNGVPDYVPGSENDWTFDLVGADAPWALVEFTRVVDYEMICLEDDTSCDGVDDDCNGSTDEGYVPTASGATCGTGACMADEMFVCDGGEIVAVCVEGQPSGDDSNCDGRDDDCDGTADQAYAPTATTCGLGICATEGQLNCVDGAPVDTCEAFPGVADDAECNGLDDDCDGDVDEEFPGGATVCGVGACAAAGEWVCDGELGPRDTCQQGVAADDDLSCDGVDNDCNGDVDDGYVADDSCFLPGVCADGNAVSTCLEGFETACQTGEATGDDSDCDGVDDDCNGDADNNYLATTTTCGVGGCAADGTLTCQQGVEVDSCVEGEPAADDSVCNGLDDDCDGGVDEEYVMTGTRCGIGGCVNQGVRACVEGGEINTCVPLEPSLSDANCNGFDEDCDGVADDDFFVADTACGTGVCAAEGQQVCSHDPLVCTTPHATFDMDVCLGFVGDIPSWCFCLDYYLADVQEGDAEIAFEQCCFVAYDRPQTEAGLDYCMDVSSLSAAVTVCEVDTCSVNWDAQAADDSACNALDDDCDGTTDEAEEADAMCDDDDQCTADSCTEGACLNVLTPTAGCDDDDPETVSDSCDYRGACEGLLPGQHRLTDEVAPPGEENDCQVCGSTDYAVATYHEFDIDDVAALPPTATITRIRVAIQASNIQGLLEYEPLPALAINDEYLAISGPGLRGPVCDSCQRFDFDTDDWFLGYDVPGYLPASVNSWAFDPLTDVEPWALVAVARTIDYTCWADDVTCDGIDDDCNGVTDDGFPDGDACTIDGLLGACAVGARRCVNGQESCEQVVFPATEVCNGADDDCNDVIDEGYVAITSCFRPGVCEAGNLSSACLLGVEYPCETGAETGDDTDCDGVDDNCDGNYDENYVVTNTECGLGVCYAQGLLACVEGLEVDSCLMGVATGGDADCNGADEDCDGVADNHYVETSTSCGQGACAAAGTKTCVAASEVDSCVEGQPAPTDMCNGLDDDCNGTTDDEASATASCQDDNECTGNFLASGDDTCDFEIGACVNDNLWLVPCGDAPPVGEAYDYCDGQGACYACAPTDPTFEELELSCTDGRDNDCDGYSDYDDLIDCCPTAPWFDGANELQCADGNDNDCDGLVDLDDADCQL